MGSALDCLAFEVCAVESGLPSPPWACIYMTLYELLRDMKHTGQGSCWASLGSTYIAISVSGSVGTLRTSSTLPIYNGCSFSNLSKV